MGEAGLVMLLLLRMAMGAQVKARSLSFTNFPAAHLPSPDSFPSRPVVFLNSSFKITGKHCRPFLEPSLRTPSTQNGRDSSSLGVTTIPFDYV